MSIISFATSFSTAMGAAMESEAMMMTSVMGLAGVSIIMSLFVIAASITYSVFAYICYYDLFRSCSPKNAVLYLVLSVVPGISTVARPLFLFLCRNKDDGMPPRRKPEAENPCEF